MEWNFRSCLNTVHEGVRAMKEEVGAGRRKGGGNVVLTSSVLALMSFTGYSSYSPSKYAIRGAHAVPLSPPPWTHLRARLHTGLAEALRNELLLYGISVHLFLPATIFSPGFENEQRLKPEITKKIEGPDEGLQPDAVARELIKGACCLVSPFTLSSSTLESRRARTDSLPSHSPAPTACTGPLALRPTGLERGDFYITYEPVGHMLRNSRAITPRNNNVVLDTLWGLAGTVRSALSLSPEGARRLTL